MEPEDLRYVILTEQSPDKLALAVSALLGEGWQLHGELKLQVMADGASLTFASVVYIQVMWRPKDA
jgi:hypothetical protein